MPPVANVSIPANRAAIIVAATVHFVVTIAAFHSVTVVGFVEFGAFFVVTVIIPVSTCFATPHDVVPFAPNQAVIARTANQTVVAAHALDAVIATIAKDDVVARCAL